MKQFKINKKVLWSSAQGYGSKYNPYGVEILSHTIESPWVDERTTVTFATYFHRLMKAETADHIYTCAYAHEGFWGYNNLLPSKKERRGIRYTWPMNGLVYSHIKYP